MYKLIVRKLMLEIYSTNHMTRYSHIVRASTESKKKQKYIKTNKKETIFNAQNFFRHIQNDDSFHILEYFCIP